MLAWTPRPPCASQAVRGSAAGVVRCGRACGVVRPEPAHAPPAAAAGANASLRGEYKGVAYDCTPLVAVVAERAAPEPAAVAPAASQPEAPVPAPLPVFFAPLCAADVADDARLLVAWLRLHGRSALADASLLAAPLARRAGAAAQRAGSAALGALDSAGRGVATCVPAAAFRLLLWRAQLTRAACSGSAVAVQRSSSPHIISIVMEQLHSGMSGACVQRTCWFCDADVLSPPL